MRLKGEFTVEAAFVFSIFFIIIAAFINLDFTIHDAVVSDTAKITMGIDYRESEIYCRDTESNRISVKAVISKPVIGSNKKFADAQKEIINSMAQEYFDKHRIAVFSELSGTDIEDVMTAEDNAQIVRAGGKVVEIIGGQK